MTKRHAPTSTHESVRYLESITGLNRPTLRKEDMRTMIITSKYPGRCAECGKEIRIGDRINWTRGVKEVSHAVCTEEGKAVAAAVEVSAALTTSYMPPCPDGLEFLGYQRAGIEFANTHKSTLIADEMGLGKTVQAIGVINANPEIHTVVIVCPASLKLNWRKELKRWSTRDTSVRIVGRKDNERSGCDVQVTIVSYQQAKKLPEVGTWDLLIADEAHNAKNPKTQQTKRLVDLSKRCTWRVFLTGTPILNRPIELFPLLDMLQPGQWSFWPFVKRYCNAHKRWMGRKSFWDLKGASNLDELNERLRTSVMVRRLKKDVLTELPPKRREVVEIGNGYRDEEQWGDMGDDYETFQARVQAIPFEEISRRRHEQGLAKLDAAAEFILNALESSAKVVVFAHHKEVISGLAERLRDALASEENCHVPHGVVTLTGETRLEDRNNAVEAFQNDPQCRVFLGSIKAAGVGLTLTAASHVIFVELSWVPADLTQAEDRCHRIGQRESVLVQHLVLEGSLDAKMARFVTEKQAIADAALDADTLSIGDRPEVESREARTARELAKVGITQEERERLHACMQFLAACCDGAASLDGQGFNKNDTNIGKSLAKCVMLSPKQALIARRLAVKYRRQLGAIA